MAMTDRNEVDKQGRGPSQAGPVAQEGTFGALRVPLFRLLWIGGVFSFLSVQMQFMVRGFLAFELTGTNSSLGLVYLGFGVPMLVASPFGGVAADRLGKRRVIIAGQLVITAISTSIGLAIVLDIIEFWMLVVSAMLQGLAFSFFGPARVAFTAQLAGRENLGNAMVLSQMALNGTRIFGPSLAGVLVGVAVIGTNGVYFITAGIMLLSLIVTLRLPPGEPLGPGSGKNPLADLIDGVRYIRSRPRLLVLMATSFTVVMVGFPYFAFFPSLVGDVFGILDEDIRARAIGGLSTTQAIGAVLATIVVARRATGDRVWIEQARWGLAFGASIVLLAFAPGFGFALVAVALAGAASSGFQALNNALVMTKADPEYHGRVQSLMMIAFGAFGIAAAPIGIIADRIGLRQTLTIMGGLVAVALMVCLVVWQRVGEYAQGSEPASVAAD
ncbi:MAG: MFS transporter [Actinomycetia bacterium]|nr:MFS transporter [Actinomycetes bacterium]